MLNLGVTASASLCRRAIKRAEEVEHSSADLAVLSSEGPESSPLLSSPTALEREGFVSSISGYGRVPEAHASLFEMKAVQGASAPERPLSRGVSKAKCSPRARNGAVGTPFSKPLPDGKLDLELGQGAPMSASRRRSSRAENEDDDEL